MNHIPFTDDQSAGSAARRSFAQRAGIDAHKAARDADETEIIKILPPSDLVGFPTLPPHGSGVVVSDDDLLASLNRDGQTLDHAAPSRSTPMEIAIAWCIGLTVGTVLMVFATVAIVGIFKLAGIL